MATAQSSSKKPEMSETRPRGNDLAQIAAVMGDATVSIHTAMELQLMMDECDSRWHRSIEHAIQIILGRNFSALSDAEYKLRRMADAEGKS